MKNYEERIYLYLDNQLSGKDKEDFEKELLRDTELNRKFLKVKSDLQEFKSPDHPDTDDSYFNNIIPEFRKRLEPRRSSVPRFVYAFSGIAAVVIALVLVLNQGNENGINEISELNTSEVESAMTEYYVLDDMSSLTDETRDRISDQIDSVIVEELSLADAGKEYLGESDINTLIAGLSEEEAEIIYSQIINKDFINGEL